MIFPKNIIGPQFDNGDLVTFNFDGAELTLRLPTIPNNKHNADRVSPLKDFRNANTQHWDSNDQSLPCLQLSEQRWCFEDGKSLDDIAQCSLYVSLVEASQRDCTQNTLLESTSFIELMLAWMDYSFAANEQEIGGVADGDPALGRYRLKSIAKPHLNWLAARVRYVPEATACPVGIVPINNRFIVMVSLEMESLHYAGRTNPYSDELLKQFEADLFEDFLSHIKIEYSPETIALIDALNNKTPA